MTVIHLPTWSFADSISNKLYSVIYLCVLSLGDARQFDNAHHAATVLSLLVKTQDIPKAWYCRGTLYAMQGDEQTAARFWQQGLERCADNSPDHRWISRRLHSIRDRRIDFVAFLPGELMCEIFLAVELDELSRCMQVSRRWCDRLAQCRELWHEVHFQGRIRTVDEQMRILPFIASHPRKITASRLSERGVAVFMHWMMQRSFDRLTQLEFQGCHINLPCTTLLSHIKHTLTELTLDVPDGSSLSVANVLTTCPRLRYLDYRDFYKPLGDTSHLFASKDFELETLRLVFWGGVSFNYIRCFLQRCPALRQLALSGGCSMDVLRIVAIECPQIQHVWINHAALETRTLQQQHLHDTQKTGMRTLLVGYSDELQPNQVLPLIKASSTTLQNLTLLVPRRHALIQQWQRICDLTTVQLTRLTCQFGPQLRLAFTALILASPALQSVHFLMCDLSSDDVLGAILQLDTLKELSIHSPTPWLDSNALARVFAKQIGLGEQATLTDVHMRNIQHTDDVDLPIVALGSMQRVETITLAQCIGATAEALHAFFDRLAKQPSVLRRINLEKMAQMSDSMIGTMLECFSTNEYMIHLVGLPNVSYQAVQNLVARHPPFSVYASACGSNSSLPPIRYRPVALPHRLSLARG